jgi:hypothetical protein
MTVKQRTELFGAYGMPFDIEKTGNRALWQHNVVEQKVTFAKSCRAAEKGYISLIRKHEGRTKRCTII